MDTSASELTRDLHFLETLHAMKSWFFTELLSRAETNDADALHTLRQDSLYRLAEFLFALRSHGVTSADNMSRLARLHNERLGALRDDAGAIAHYGITADRLEKALFSEESLSKLIANYSSGDAGIDQSDLARFLVLVMSAETCRRLVVACDKAGFVSRVRSPYGAILVRSNGILEEVMATVLRKARHEITG